MAKPIKILLVEDSKFVRIATERALARAGYEIFSAGDGDEAVVLARQKQPDLILLDMLLPKRSGEEVLRLLKRDPETRSTPVVVMTGLSEKNAERLLQDGASGFLEKSALDLEHGADKLIEALSAIMKNLSSVPARTGTPA